MLMMMIIMMGDSLSCRVLRSQVGFEWLGVMKAISESERKYIRLSCNKGIRNDGRGPFDLRSLSAECDILPNCNGSSRVSLGSSVDIVCGIKVCDLGLPTLCLKLV